MGTITATITAALRVSASRRVLIWAVVALTLLTIGYSIVAAKQYTYSRCSDRRNAAAIKTEGTWFDSIANIERRLYEGLISPLQFSHDRVDINTTRKKSRARAEKC